MTEFDIWGYRPDAGYATAAEWGRNLAVATAPGPARQARVPVARAGGHGLACFGLVATGFARFAGTRKSARCAGPLS
ncbi:hypothetical protein ACFWG6_27895 [Streptomyces erythrochromogenes]|uniref:hypothetical protein n=1 Tax=Streptomyces erythrochromogenes TaxID=285574 RepID=UPI00363FEC95